MSPARAGEYVRWLKRTAHEGGPRRLCGNASTCSTSIARAAAERARGVRAGDRPAEARAGHCRLSARARGRSARARASRSNTGRSDHAGDQAAVRANHRRSPAPGAASPTKPEPSEPSATRRDRGHRSMVVVMQERASDEQVQRVIAKLVEMGFDVHRSTGALRTVLGAVGGTRQFDAALLEVLDGVQEVLRITEPYKLASRTFKPDNTVVTDRRRADRRRRSDRHGRPCSAETEEQVEATRRRGQARRREGPARRRVQAAQQPYSFQGLGEEGLRLLRRRADRHNMKLVSEVMDISQLELIERYCRHPAGRRAQHAELHAAARARSRPQAGHAQARHLGDDRGMAAVGGVHPRRRQHERDAVRARHPHVRELRRATRSTSRPSRWSRS